MGKKLVYTVLAALFIFGLLFLLWAWLFSGAKTPAAINNGQFGTASDTPSTIVGGTDIAGNGQVNLGGNTSNGTLPIGGNGNSNISNGNAFGNGNVNVQGVTWLTSTTSSGNTTGGINGGSTANGFNPTALNGINGGSLGGSVPTIGGAVADPSNPNSGINTLLASGLIGAASCALQASGNTIGSFISGGTAAVGVSAAVGVVAVPVNDVVGHSFQGAEAVGKVTDKVITFQACITNVLAKAALQQITASVVNWINSGFNGQPSFITNYQQFFTNVADLAAGQYIQGAGLSFLCSPFKLQIKVAIAQSYAQRNNAQSCSLTGVIKNINGFMNGNFSQGGWGGFLSFTTMPTNNPYGAYVYGQIGLQNAQTTALSNAKNNISPTGFLAVQKLNCNGSTTYNPTLVAGMNQQAALAGGAATTPSGCKASITTPGTVIESSLTSVNDTSLKQLGLANSIDQILNALVTQLVTKTLQNGLSNLSGTSGYQNSAQTPQQSAAQAKAQTILTNLQAQITLAQQYGTIKQGSIADIENAQSRLNSLSNCWLTAASSTSASASQSANANSNAAAAQASLTSLAVKIDAYNNDITTVNATIAQIQQLQSEALSVSSTADVATLTTDYNAAVAAHIFVTQTDVDTAQQNRTTLQSQMSFLNNTTATSMQQCQAFGR